MEGLPTSHVESHAWAFPFLLWNMKAATNCTLTAHVLLRMFPFGLDTYTYITTHCITFTCPTSISLHDSALCCTAQHCITLHESTLHFIARLCFALHYMSLHHICIGLHSFRCISLCDITLHYTTLHCTTLHALTSHDSTLHYTTLHYITFYFITFHYVLQHFTT